MPTLQILLLGSPEIRWDNEIITIRRRIPRSLLIYLASRGCLVDRGEIISNFWGPDSDNNTRLRLNEGISRLRSALPDSSLIISEGQLIGLDHEKAFVDQHAFENLLDQAGRIPWQIPENEPLPDSIHNLLTQAKDLWRGANFLPGSFMPGTIDLEHWHTLIASRLEQRRRDVLQRLAAHAYVIGDVREGLVLAQTALTSDPLDEKLQYQVMRYLIDLGRLKEARNHFKNTQKLLQEELDINPPAKLVSLYNRIRTLNTSTQPKHPPKWELHPSVTVPFFGRKEIILQIRKAIHQNKGVFILGEAGQGKTRLIQEFSKQMQPAHRVLVTTCRPLETTLPFQPICDVLRRHVDPDEWLSLPTVWANQLVKLFPELDTMREDLERRGNAEDATFSQATLLEAIRQVFMMLGKNNGLLLVVDDAQWADEATLSTISFLLSRAPFNNTSALVALSRSEEPSQHLKDLISSTQLSKQGEVFHLAELNSNEIRDISRFVLQVKPPSSFIENIARSTGGNPLFLLETLRSVIGNSPSIELETITHLPLAESLQKIIRSRLRNFGESTKNILEAAAIIGAEFDAKEISRITGKNEIDVALTLEKLESDNILQAGALPSNIAKYRFIHDKFREAIAVDIPTTRSRRLHESVAAIILESDQPKQAAILAYHFENAGKLIQAFDYWLEAGNQARQLFSMSDASRSFRQAQKIIPAIEKQLTEKQIYDLYATWSEIAYETQNTGLVRSLGTDLLQIGEKRQSPLLIGTALDTLSDACMTENDFESGLDLATKAIPYVEQSTNLFEHIEAYVHRGVFLYMLNRPDEAIESFEDALALGINEITPDVIRARSNAHYQISLLRTLGGWPKRAREHALLSLQDANTSLRTYLQISAHFVLALSSYYLGEYHKAKDYAYAGIERARKTEGWRMLGYLLGSAAATELMMGNFDKALAHTEETLLLGEKYELNDVVALGCRNYGDILMQLQVFDEAISYFERGVDAIGEHFLGVDNLIRLGYARSISNQKEMGYQILAFALAAIENINLDLGCIITKYFQSLAHFTHQEFPQAKPLANQVKDEANWRSIPSFYLGANNILGKIALRNNNEQEAIEYFQIAASEARLMGNSWIELDALRFLKNFHDPIAEFDYDPTSRLDEILQSMDENCSNPLIRPQFLSFKSQISQASIHTL